MKKSFLTMLTVLFASVAIMAQNPMDQAKNATSSGNINSIISTLTSNIQPSAFTSSFAKTKDDFVKKLSGMSATDLSSTGAMLGQLASGLKPSSFLNGWKPTTDWLNKLKSNTNLQSLASQASDLVKNLDPKIFNKGFDPSTITSALGMLGGMK